MGDSYETHLAEQAVVLDSARDIRLMRYIENIIIMKKSRPHNRRTAFLCYRLEFLYKIV